MRERKHEKPGQYLPKAQKIMELIEAELLWLIIDHSELLG
jgi:hypothetical protein